MTQWNLKGRVVITLPDDSGKGRITWEQKADRLEMTFRGPFGAGGFRVAGSLDQLKLTTKSGESYLSADPEADLARELGWQVPVQSFGYWIRGIPDPNRATQSLAVDEAGLLRDLSQSGWRIQYQNYRSYQGRELPRKLLLTGEQVKLKVATEGWSWSD